MREKLFIATFSYGAIEEIKTNQLHIEINHTCISEDLNEENRETLLTAIRRDIKDSGADRIIVHGPFTEIFPAGIDARARAFARTRLEEGWQVCHAIGAEAMVVHTGYVPFMYFKEWQAEKSAVFWQDFMKDKPASFRLYIENVLEDEPYMMVDMMKQISDPRIRLCLDVGHSAAAGRGVIPITEWIRAFGPYMGHLHLHNNFEDRDSHGAFDDGLMDFHEIFKAIDAYCDPRVTYTIESRDCAASIRWLKAAGYLI